MAAPIGNHFGRANVDRTAYAGEHDDAGRTTRTAAGTVELPFTIAVATETVAAVGS